MPVLRSDEATAYRVELTTRDGCRVAGLSGLDAPYPSPEAALAATLPPARDYAVQACRALWLQVRDGDAEPVFGTLVP